MVEGTEAGVREDEVVLRASAGLQLREHVLIGIRGDAIHRDTGRIVEALLDFGMDVVLPRHHDDRVARGPNDVGESGNPAERQSGAGRALDENPTRNP